MSEGPTMWFGGERVHAALLDRLARYRSGYHPLGRVTPADVSAIKAGFAAAGRSTDGLELIGGTRVDFPADDAIAPLPEAFAEIPRQQALGFTTFCREVIERVDGPKSG